MAWRRNFDNTCQEKLAVQRNMGVGRKNMTSDRKSKRYIEILIVSGKYGARNKVAVI